MKRLLLATLIATTSCSVLASERLMADTATQIEVGVDAYRVDKSTLTLNYSDAMIESVNTSLVLLYTRTEDNKTELDVLSKQLYTCGKEASQWLGKTYSDDECDTFKEEHQELTVEETNLRNSYRYTKELQLMVITGQSKQEDQERERIQQARLAQEQATKDAEEQAKRDRINLKRAEARERNRIEANARYVARVAELKSKKASMTQDEINARESTVRINSYKMCQNASDDVRNQAQILRREIRREINKAANSYRLDGYSAPDAAEMARENYSHMFVMSDEQFEKAAVITDKCLEQRVFWDF